MMASISISAASENLKPSWPKILIPLSRHGLCEALTTMPAAPRIPSVPKRWRAACWETVKRPFYKKKIAPAGAMGFAPIRLAAGARGHLFDHGDHQLAVTIVQVAGIAANLAQKADFVVRQLRHRLGVAVVVAGFGEELPQLHLHRARDLGQRIERRDGVPVLHARKIAAQQAGAFFDIALRHPLLQTEIADGVTDIHGCFHW